MPTQAAPSQQIPPAASKNNWTDYHSRFFPKNNQTCKTIKRARAARTPLFALASFAPSR
jgi:hypothetical protein